MSTMMMLMMDCLVWLWFLVLDLDFVESSSGGTPTFFLILLCQTDFFGASAVVDAVQIAGGSFHLT